MKKNNPPTIREIARLVGVSANTVSRALNNKPDVSPETKKNIIKTAQFLNYTPNAIARALVQRTTRTIGMVMSDISDPFFGEMVKDAEVFFRSRGYNPVSYTHLRAHETVLDLVCRILLAQKKKKTTHPHHRYISHSNPFAST